MKTTFCTISCTNYLPKAILLAESIKKHHPDAAVILCLLEKSAPRRLGLSKHFDKVVLAKNLPMDYFDWYLFKYDQLEASTFIKATLLKQLLGTYGRVIYLDPDIYVYSPLQELFELPHDIIVTPHQVNPTSSLKIIDSSVIGFMLCGIFNLGFICVNKTKHTLEFLDWWENKLMYYAFLDFKRGLFTDQKWIDLAYTQFNIHSLTHPGYNVANWNICERDMHISGRDQYFINRNAPLRFFHFSSIDTGKDIRIFRLLARRSTLKTILALRDTYKKRVAKHDKAGLSTTEWSYDYFDNGEKINKLCRFTFFKSKKIRKLFIKPYEASNEKILSIGY